MYISLRESCANGFKRWSDYHQPKDGDDRNPSEANGVIPGPGFYNSDTESPELTIACSTEPSTNS
jgi:hypothetical protein